MLENIDGVCDAATHTRHKADAEMPNIWFDTVQMEMFKLRRRFIVFMPLYIVREGKVGSNMSYIAVDS
ncbi:MAG: hypothetical protein OXU51_26105 [Candidatus Poribacteria bacterium]|nr:hypothetical protein [Candidatus Poribacteria bacterium]